MAKNLHDGHRERIRERYLREGLDYFEDHQVLELLLFYCIPRGDTNELAHRLLEKFGTLHNLIDADPKDIMNCKGAGEQTAVLLTLIPSVLRRYRMSKYDKTHKIDTSQKAGEFALGLLEGRTREALFIICLDSKWKYKNCEMLSEGTLTQTSFYIRDIMEAIVRDRATKVILAHNHPGGELTPSDADVDATKKIIRYLRDVEVEVMDHIIVAGNKYLSFAEKGILNMYY